MELLGLLILDLSILLAFAFQYRHYYELLVLGLFLILYALDAKFLFLPTYIRLYKQFVKAGIILDLFLGIILTNLWHYTFTSIWEYLPLYLVAYPLAGLVMVQTFALFSRLLLRGKRETYFMRDAGYRRAGYILNACVLLSAAGILATWGGRLFLLTFFVAVILRALLLLAYATHLHRRKNLLDKLHAHPFLITVVLVLTIYINAFIQELPNVTAKEWIYTNLPLTQASLGGLPVIVLLGWPFLALYPASAYLYVMPGNARKAPRQRQRPQAQQLTPMKAKRGGANA